MDTPILRAEHLEFTRRMETELQRLSDEDSRQNRRIGELEEKQSKILELASSVERLAVSVENMLAELKNQGARLTALENQDGDMWRTAVKYVLAALIGGAIAMVFAKFGG